MEQKKYPVKTTIRLSEEMFRWIGRGSYLLNDSASQIIRDAVKMYLKRMGVEPPVYGNKNKPIDK